MGEECAEIHIRRDEGLMECLAPQEVTKLGTGRCRFRCQAEIVLVLGDALK